MKHESRIMNKGGARGILFSLFFPQARIRSFWKLVSTTGANTRNFSVEKYPYSKKANASAAFTLVELLVSVGIFTLITTAAVFNNAQFNGNVVLSNLAYEVALSIRQAQFYGITVKQSTSNTFDAGYGINFNISTPTSYLLFEDKPVPNKIYDAGEALETYVMRKGNFISKICLSQAGACSSYPSVDISFIRPNPEAYIRHAGSFYSKAEICVSSPGGSKRKVVVESTGQISVAIDTDGVCN